MVSNTHSQGAPGIPGLQGSQGLSGPKVISILTHKEINVSYYNQFTSLFITGLYRTERETRAHWADRAEGILIKVIVLPSTIHK